MAIRRKPFRPQILAFEDRIVPASYYVDNAFIGANDGDIVTFNAGQPNEVTGLVVGTNAFAFFGDAIAKADLDTDADDIFFANGTFVVDQANNGGAFTFSNALSFIGSGKDVTILKSVSDTLDASGTNGALFAAQNTFFSVSNLTLDGDGQNGKLTASGFRFENSVGTITNTRLVNVSDLAGSSSAGYPVVAVSGSNVNVIGNTFSNNGRGGVRLDDSAQGTIQSNTFTGRGGNAATDVNFGVDVTDGSSALISGNTFTGFLGTDGVFVSAAIQVASSIPASPSSALILGNTLDGNNTGIIIGIGGGDQSFATIQYNNILNNDPTLGPGSGIFTDTLGAVIATNNFWGTGTGPQASDNPTGTDTSSVTDGVTYKDAGISQPPNGIAQDPLPVQPVNTPGEAANGASPSVVSVVAPTPPASAPIVVQVTFNEEVSGLTPGDFIIGGTAGPGTVTSVTTTDNILFNVTIAGLNVRGDAILTLPASSTTNAAGFGNNDASFLVPFQPPFDRGFAVGGDAGAVTPVIGVTDTFETRFNMPAFPGFTGGERVATADLNGDGTLDYIVATGPGTVTTVTAFDGITQLPVFSIQPFGQFTRGALVSAGDLTGDGLAEIVITAENGGGARIRIFSPDGNGNFNQTSDFFGLVGSDDIPDVSFRGGGRSAIGDFNGDGRNDLVFAAGTGGGPRIAIFNGLTLGLNGGPKLTGDFFVYEPTLRNGSFVAAGDLNNDGIAELVTGAGNGGTRVRVINGATLFNSNGQTVTAIADFFAFTANIGSGVRVAATDLTGDGRIDVIAGVGPGAGSTVRVFSGNNLLANGANPAITEELNLFGAFAGGVYVG